MYLILYTGDCFSAVLKTCKYSCEALKITYHTIKNNIIHKHQMSYCLFFLFVFNHISSQSTKAICTMISEHWGGNYAHFVLHQYQVSVHNVKCNHMVIIKNDVLCLLFLFVGLFVFKRPFYFLHVCSAV